MNDKEIDYNLLEVEKGNKRYVIYLKNYIQDQHNRIHDLLKDNTEYKLENERLNNIINEIRDNRNDLTEDKVYLKMSKETLVKTINIKRNTISYIRIKRNKLQARIDKAIEQINKSIYTYNGEGIYEVYDIPQIIAILKGSDKDE